MSGGKAVVHVVIDARNKIEFLQTFKKFFRPHNILEDKMLERLGDHSGDDICSCGNNKETILHRQQHHYK